jgi:hypothetical protein
MNEFSSLQLMLFKAWSNLETLQKRICFSLSTNFPNNSKTFCLPGGISVAIPAETIEPFLLDCHYHQGPLTNQMHLIDPINQSDAFDRSD